MRRLVLLMVVLSGCSPEITLYEYERLTAVCISKGMKPVDTTEGMINGTRVVTDVKCLDDKGRTWSAASIARWDRGR